MKLALVLDFDSTITTKDINVEIIKKYADPGWDVGLRRWRAGEFDQRQLIEWEFARLPGDRLPEMREFALTEADVRPGLHGLLELCRSNDVPVEVVSNGMSFYIEAILGREGMSDLAFVAPIPTLRGIGNGPVVEFGEGVETCEKTGLCKCARARRLRSGDRKIVFVGDGISDFCIAEEEADFIIARSWLKDHCVKNGIAHNEFSDFDDVARVLGSLLAGRS
jgi:2-hydroxy-3-keto-5-methylthiopentenyl-1-phosphate phosphatase